MGAIRRRVFYFSDQLRIWGESTDFPEKDKPRDPAAGEKAPVGNKSAKDVTMKENTYDDERFFAAYSRMPRSVEGLRAAGEWHELRKLLPDFTGQRALDLGCGFGWHCVYAAEHGAAAVLGIDLSEKMLERAREQSAGWPVEYRRVALEDYEYPPEAFDVALSSLAFHYVEDFRVLARKVARTLRPGGAFVFSVEHPGFTAYGTQDWFYDEAGVRLHWPVDRYFDEGARRTVFLGESVVKYHKTLTTYLNGLLEAGFDILRVVEPEPDPALLDSVPDMRDELRRPMMLLVSARKK